MLQALIVVTVVAMLGASYLNLTSSLARRQSSALNDQQAFYLAEGGLAEAFQAVRMGRTGQVASEASPAAFGQGLVFVEAVELADGSVRLDSTGIYETGRRTLSLVVEPVDPALGFFADEDLVMDSVVLMDGWNSGENTYAEASTGGLPLGGELAEYAAWLVTCVGRKVFNKMTINVIDDPFVVHAETLSVMTPEELEEFGEMLPALRLAYPAGYTIQGPVESYGGYQVLSDSEDAGATAPESVLGETTGDGARLGSNGDVHFTIPEGEVAEVWGDVLPGPLGSVTGLGNVTIAGSTSSRGSAIELPVVEVPAVALAAPVRHDELLPMLISSGSSGYERIEVAPGADLIISGPATVVIGSLILEPDATLTLDTRFGEVSLFVTDELDLQPESFVSTSGDQPDETTVQVSSTSSDPLNPAVKLDATSQFYGTVYAPDSDVHIGSDFEIFGGVVARRLDVAAGARLHFDNSGFAGSALPRIVGWRVIEVPAATKALRGNPFRALGLDPNKVTKLANAHDLDAVQMDLEYIDNVGVTRTYTGLESGFDWANASEVVKVERQATREKEDDAPPTEEPPTEEPVVGVRAEVETALVDLSGTPLKNALDLLAPLTANESKVLIDSDRVGGGHLKELLMASSPLSDGPLITLINTDRMTSGQATEVIMASMPLSAEALAAVVVNQAGVLLPEHIAVIVDASK